MSVQFYSSIEELPFTLSHPLIADETVAKLFFKKLPPFNYLLPSGEACKTREEKEKIENILFDLGAEKASVLQIVGGGAACDVGGFAAATFLRGIEHLLIPTTLLAMVDASLGGKTAINVPQGKNLLGSFHPPKSVWICLEFLSTLPLREFFCGYAEMVKIALLYDAKEAAILLNIDDLKKEMVLERIQKAIHAKLAVIKRDPKERGERALLNFGHTVGHALECASKYLLPHGEAIFLGMVVEIEISYLMGKMSLEKKRYLQTLLKKKSKDITCQNVSAETLLSYMRRDKKNKDKKIYVTLLVEEGRAFVEGGWTHPIPEYILEKAINSNALSPYLVKK